MTPTVNEPREVLMQRLAGLVTSRIILRAGHTMALVQLATLVATLERAGADVQRVGRAVAEALPGNY